MPEPLVDRAFLERLERLTLQWQRSFQGLVGGHNPSKFGGTGQEFLDHRNFHSGDDLRAVNWRAYMRFERFYLKMFQIEPRVPVRLLLDNSASMLAGTSGTRAPSKFDYARRLAAALIYIGLVRLDTITVQPFTNKLTPPFLASGGRHRFQPAEAYLRDLTAHGQTDFETLARQFLGLYPQRGLAIIVSDFLDDGACLRALQHLADYGHELLLVQLWTPDDRTPATMGELELIDSESGEHRTLSVDARAAKAYTDAFDLHAATVEKLALRNGGRYAGLSTDESLDEVLFGALVRPQ